MIPGWSWPAAEVPDEMSRPPIKAKSITVEASLMLFPKVHPPKFSWSFHMQAPPHGGSYAAGRLGAVAHSIPKKGKGQEFQNPMPLQAVSTPFNWPCA